MTCFLFGHRDASENILPRLVEAVEEHYAMGARNFVVGGYGNFDRLAASAVKQVKKHHGDICLRLLLPYHPALRPVETPPGFDGTFYPGGLEAVPKKYAILRANQYMIRTADSFICYVRHFGNTRQLLEQAEKRAKRGKAHIQNLQE